MMRTVYFMHVNQLWEKKGSEGGMGREKDKEEERWKRKEPIR